MDLTQTIIAKSDQLNADDLISGPQTFTVADVRMGDSEQPVCIVLAEWPANRPFKPSKTVLRILVMAWGKESDEWPKGARMTLFRDAGVKWAGQAIGGIRVSHLSHIEGKLKVALQESKGKKVLYTVDPILDAPAEPTRTAQRPTAKRTPTDPDPVAAEDDDGMITKAQQGKMGALMKEHGMTERPAALAFVSKTIGRSVITRNELTRAEASRVIDALEGFEPEPEVEPGDPDEG